MHVYNNKNMNITWDLVSSEIDVKLLENLKNSKYKNPTKIQEKTVYEFLMNKDVNVKSVIKTIQ